MKHFLCIAAVLFMPQSVLGAPPAFTNAQLCQAAIATNNGHSTKIIKVKSSQDGIVIVSYIRPSDGKSFSFWCKIESAEVRWRDEYSERWAQNLRVYYKVLDAGRKLEVRSIVDEVEDSALVKIFTENDFK